MTGVTGSIRVNRPAIVDETIDGEVVAVDLERGSYFSIRGAGVDIWRALGEPTTPETVVARIASRYGRREADIADEVTRFVAELDSHGLLRPADDGPATAVEVADLPHDTAATFEAPRLEKFTDMEDLLLLDPVHDVDGRGWPHAAAN